MLRIVLCGLGVFFAICSLLASGYICVFAWLGIRGRSSRDATHQAGSKATRFLLLIPAHNEADGIVDTIESALSLHYPKDRFRVVVIADNCSDDTAAVAGQNGAEVWIREDSENRGKGQALAWALARARKSEYDMLVIVDADTRIDPRFLEEIDREYSALKTEDRQIAYQGRYDFASFHEPVGWFDSFTLASKAAENSFVYYPRSCIGLVNLLQGNGFCVSRAALDMVPFRASSIVEDAEYAVALALSSVPIRYVDAARVVSRTTRTVQDAAPQRLRWASGMLQLIVRYVPKLLAAAIRKHDWKLAEGSVMMLLSSRLTVIYLAIAGLVFTLLGARGAWMELDVIVLTVACLLQGVYLVLAFRCSGREPMPLRPLLFMPAYFVLIGIAQAGALFGARRRQWCRTVR